MHKIVRGGLIVVLVLAGGLCPAPPSLAAAEKSGEVAETVVPFAAGEVVPEFAHNILKIESLTIQVGEVQPKSGKQKIDLAARIQNFGEKDHKVIVTFTLRDKDDKIIAGRTVKNDIDDNDRETFSSKFTLAGAAVERVEKVQLELSYLPD